MTDGAGEDMIQQSFSDCFRMKASSTLQKRAQSLWRLASWLKSRGVLNPLRLTEPQLYDVLCDMRSSNVGATSAQHIIEALLFLDSTVQLTLMDLRSVVSACCRGVARDMYLNKSPLVQKSLLTVEQVKRLELLCNLTMKYIAAL